MNDKDLQDLTRNICLKKEAFLFKRKEHIPYKRKESNLALKVVQKFIGKIAYQSAVDRLNLFYQTMDMVLDDPSKLDSLTPPQIEVLRRYYDHFILHCMHHRQSKVFSDFGKDNLELAISDHWSLML